MKLLQSLILFFLGSIFLQFYFDPVELGFFDWARDRLHQNNNVYELEAIYPSSALRMRGEPTSKGAVITSMYKNQVITFLSCEKDGWIKVSTGTELGYAHGNYLLDKNKQKLADRCN